MAQAKQSPSLAEYIVPYEPGGPIQRVTFLGRTPVVVREDGTLVLGPPETSRRVSAHADGAILVSAATSDTLVTGGDDGLVVRTSADGGVETLYDAKGNWIDAIATRKDGAVAWSVGKTIHARDAQGVVKKSHVPTTGRGLAFAPKGYRLAIAHYNGVSLWFPNTVTPADILEWKGSHLDVSFSPDGRFVVTSMQESALHGWRIADKANMRMSGYPSRVRSQAWSADGEWLATSGADSCVVWPFRDKDGPMNKAPRECAVRKAKVSRVAFHPKALLLAVGYEDGWILLARLTDETEMLVRRPDANRQAISSLAWSHDGLRLLFGTSGGDAGLLSLPET
jgi:WD40 repeat protein